MAFLRPDGSSFTVFTEKVLGLGQSGIVVRRGEHALKIAKIRDTLSMPRDERENEDCMRHVAQEILQNEKRVYERIGNYSGIAECVELLPDGILLVFYGGGDLHEYISRKEELDWWRKKDWILSLIETVAHLHDSRVLIDDLALRNVLVADDFSLKMIDFGQCTILPLDSDPSTASVNDLTVKYDFFHLGCLIYSLAAWQTYDNDFFGSDSEFPPLNDLPPVDHLPCADLIRRCWTGGYSNIHELRSDAHQTFSISSRDIFYFWVRRSKSFLRSMQPYLPGSH